MGTNRNEKTIMQHIFDLTTSRGINEALRAAKDADFLLLIAGPLPYVAKKLFDKGARLTIPSISTLEEQKQAAIEIIKAGKEHNASSLEITLDQKAGIELGSKIEGMPIQVIAGKSGKVTIKVQYK